MGAVDSGYALFARRRAAATVACVAAVRIRGVAAVRIRGVAAVRIRGVACPTRITPLAATRVAA